MTARYSGIVAGGVFALTLVALPLQAQDAPAGPILTQPSSPQQCEIAFEPEEVAIQGENANVEADFSESIGLISEVEFPDGSGLEMVGDAPTPITGNRYRMVLNTESAQQGNWTVTVTGAEGTCAGTLRVAAGSPDPAPQTPPAEPAPEPAPDPAPLPDPAPDPAPIPDSDPAPTPDPFAPNTDAGPHGA